MARRPKQAPIVCEHFVWHLRQRSGIFYADGRFNTVNLGKHSLDTHNYATAMENLRRLDLKKATELGRVAARSAVAATELSIEDGWERYLDDRQKPLMFGGVAASSWKRYRTVRDKHQKFCRLRGIEYWSQINAKSTEDYGLWLSNDEYAERSVYLEVNAVKTVVNWMIREKLLSPALRVDLPLVKPDGCDTYCYTIEEVSAMILHCRRSPELHWLSDVLIGLACTGLRINEFASVRWSDVDLKAEVLRLTDERWSYRRKKLGKARHVKGKRSRTLPLHGELISVLSRMPRSADGLVFHGPRGGKLNDGSVRTILVNNVIKPLTSRYPTSPGEIGFEHGRLHSFRHYFCSESFRNGATEAELLEWLGHRDSKMVAHYRHLRPDDSKRRMKQMKLLDLANPSERAG